MMRQRRAGNSGMTLLELVVGSAIFMMMIGLVMVLLGAGQDSYNTGVIRSNLRERAAAALERIVTEVRPAGVSTLEVYDGGTLTNTNGDRVDFRKAVGSDGFDPTWGNRVSYRLSGDNVLRIELRDSGQVISQGVVNGGVSDLYFEVSRDTNGAEKLLIRLTLQAAAAGGRPPHTATAQTTVTFRN